MRKDIIIPVVENVFMAVVEQWSDDFMEKVWMAHLVNDSDFMLENVIVVSKAYGEINGEQRKTSVLRHSIPELPSVSVAKIEMIEKSLLPLTNEFLISFFIGNTLYDKKFVFEANTIDLANAEEVPILWTDGVIVR